MRTWVGLLALPVASYGQGLSLLPPPHLFPAKGRQDILSEVMKGIGAGLKGGHSPAFSAYPAELPHPRRFGMPAHAPTMGRQSIGRKLA